MTPEVAATLVQFDERLTAVELVVRAVVATHPNQAALTTMAEQLVALTQAGAAARGQPVGPGYRAAAERLLSPPPPPPAAPRPGA